MRSITECWQRLLELHPEGALRDCCVELTELSNTGVLPDRLVRTFGRMLAREGIDQSEALKVAKGHITRMAIETVARG